MSVKVLISDKRWKSSRSQEPVQFPELNPSTSWSQLAWTFLLYRLSVTIWKQFNCNNVPTEKRRLVQRNPKRKSLLLLRPSATWTSANTPPWTSAPAFCPRCLRTKDHWWRQRACLLHLRRPLWTWRSAKCTRSRRTLCRTPCLRFLPTPASTVPPDTSCSKWAGWTNSLLRGKTATLKPSVVMLNLNMAFIVTA